MKDNPVKRFYDALKIPVPTDEFILNKFADTYAMWWGFNFQKGEYGVLVIEFPIEPVKGGRESGLSVL